MASRREQEDRSPEAAFAAAQAICEEDAGAPETARYLQFSDYERVLSEYLRLYGRERMLILFQEDLDTCPEKVMRQICGFLGIDAVIPKNIGVRVHQSGEVRFKALSKLLKSDNIIRRALRFLVPRRLRPTLVFWFEIFNIRPVKAEGMPEALRRAYGDFTHRQAAFLWREFGLVAPWPTTKTSDQNDPQ
jgi:hypothetical protein